MYATPYQWMFSSNIFYCHYLTFLYSFLVLSSLMKLKNSGSWLISSSPVYISSHSCISSSLGLDCTRSTSLPILHLFLCHRWHRCYLIDRLADKHVEESRLKHELSPVEVGEDSCEFTCTNQGVSSEWIERFPHQQQFYDPNKGFNDYCYHSKPSPEVGYVP